MIEIAVALAAWLVASLPTSHAFLLPSSASSSASASATKIYRNVVPSVEHSHRIATTRPAITCIAATDRHYSFDEMKAMEYRLENLERGSPDILSAYYEPHLKSFSVRPGSVKEISVTSTCFALQTIFATGDCSTFSNVVDPNMKSKFDTSDGAEKSSSRIPIR